MLRLLGALLRPRERGAAAEDEALRHLQAAGLTLVARNVLARGGELDLVMRDGPILVFVEVRYRHSDSHGDGIASVAKQKQTRIVRAARQFLADHPQERLRSTRFDVVSLGSGGLRWERNAFVLDTPGW